MAAPANISNPVLVASSAAQSFTLPQARSGVDIAVVFYTSALALPGEEIASGTGTRDIIVTGIARGFASDSYQPAEPGLEMLFDGGTVSALAARTLKGFSFGAQQLRSFAVEASGGADPGGAVAYRIWVYA